MTKSGNNCFDSGHADALTFLIRRVRRREPEARLRAVYVTRLGVEKTRWQIVADDEVISGVFDTDVAAWQDAERGGK